jgi:hypothetical protein
MELERRTLGPAAAAFLLLLLTTLGCSLVSETPRFVNRYNKYTCRATLVDTATGEVRMLVSNAPEINPLPSGETGYVFFDYDWDADSDRDIDDVLLDWRRYINSRILTSPNYTGRSWCIRPADTSCERDGTHDVRVEATPSPLPDGTAPTDCPPSDSGARLEVTAPGLTADNQLVFADTPTGLTSATVTVTVANNSILPLVVNSADLIGAGDSADFEKLAAGDSCQPDPDERRLGVGHTLDPTERCSFAVRFRPQSRAGAPVCDSAGVNETCRRYAALEVAGQTSMADGGRALPPLYVRLSGRVIGGRLLIEPATNEVCFTGAPSNPGECTETLTIRMSNGGPGELTIYSAGLAGDSATNGFQQLAPAPMLPRRLAPGEYVEAYVRYCHPLRDATGADGGFTVNSDDPRGPRVVTLVNPLVRRCP